MNIFSLFNFQSCLNDVEERYRQFDPLVGPFRLKFLAQEQIEFLQQGFKLYSETHQNIHHYLDRVVIEDFEKKRIELKKAKESSREFSELRKLLAKSKEFLESPESQAIHIIEANLPKYAQISASLLHDATWEKFPEELKVHKAEWLKCGKFAHYSTAAILEAFTLLKILKNTWMEARKEISFRVKELSIEKVGPLIDRINPFFIPEVFLENYRTYLESQLSLVTKEKEKLILAMLHRLKFMADNRQQHDPDKLPRDDVLGDLINKVRDFIQEGPWAHVPRQSHFSAVSRESFYQLHVRILKHINNLAQDKNAVHSEIQNSFEALFWISGNETCPVQLVRKKKTIIIVPRSHAYLTGEVDSSSYNGPHIADLALYLIQNEQLSTCLRNQQYEKVSKLIHHISIFLIQQKQIAKNPKFSIASANKQKLVDAWQKIFLESVEKLLEKTSRCVDECLKDILTYQTHDLIYYQLIKSLKLLAAEFERNAARRSPILSFLNKIKNAEKTLLHKNYLIKVDQNAEAYFYYFDKLNLVISHSLQASLDLLLRMKNAKYPFALFQLEEAISQLWPDKGLCLTILQRLLSVQLKVTLRPNKDLFSLVAKFEKQHAFRDVNMMDQWINAHTSKLIELLEKFLNVHDYPLEELKEDLEILRLCEKYIQGIRKTLKENIRKYVEGVNLEELEKIKATHRAEKNRIKYQLNQKHNGPDLAELNQLMSLEDNHKNCLHLLLLLKDEPLILAYGLKWLHYYESKNFINLEEHPEFVQLCFLSPELRAAVSQRLLAFCRTNIHDITQYYPDWTQLNQYLEVEDSKSFSKEFSAIFFEKLAERFSLEGDFMYLRKFLSFKFTFLPEDRAELESKLEEMTQNEWDYYGGRCLESLSKYLKIKSLQSYRYKWLKGLITVLNIDPKIPMFYESVRGFNGLCKFYGLDQLSKVFESIKELYKQPALSKHTYELLRKYLDTKADLPEQSEESHAIQKMYVDYCTLADEINRSLDSQIPVIGEVMVWIELGNYQAAVEKIVQHSKQLPPVHVSIFTQHQMRAKQVMDMLFEKLENWLIEKIRDEGFHIKAFKDAFASYMTPRLELLCTHTDAIRNLGICIQKLADSCEIPMAEDIHLTLNKSAEHSQWYAFLIDAQLFSFLNCQPLAIKSLLKETIQKIFMRTQDPLLKKACMISMPLLRNLNRACNDLHLKDEEIAFQQILCKMFLRDNISCLGNLTEPLNSKVGLDLLRISQRFSKNPSYQESLPELKILYRLKDWTLGNNSSVSIEDLKDELQKFKQDSCAFPLSSSYHIWDAVLKSIFTLYPESDMSLPVNHSVLGERYLHPGIQKQLFDASHHLLEKAKVDGKFKHTVASVVINDRRVFFKFSPQGLGIQTMVSTLERILFGEGMPVTLVELPAIIAGNKRLFPTQLSLGVEGATVAELWNHNASLDLFKVDLKNFSQNFIRILFDRELDGQPANYVATKHRQNSKLYSLKVIDSEQGFGKLEGEGSLQIVSLVFCLDEMKQPLHPEVAQHILSLDPYEVISQFITDIDLQTQQYLRIFSQKARQNQFSQNEMAVLQPPLTREMVRDIFITFCQLQDVLKNRELISHLELLEQIHPKVASIYEQLLNENIHPMKRFEQLSREQNRHVIVNDGEERFFMSSLRNRRFYKSITPKTLKSEEDLQNEIIKPRDALEYLNELKKLYEELESIQKDLLNEKEERFINLEDSFLKEAVINGIEGRFKGISFQAISPEKQEKILSFMEGMSFKCLRLKGCAETLTPQKLKTLLTSSPHLQLLDISGCKKINDQSFQEAIDLVEKVEVLILDDTDLTFVGSENFLRHLQYLSMRNCHQLKNIEIKSPSLKKVYLDHHSYNDLCIDRRIKISKKKSGYEWSLYVLRAFTFPVYNTIENIMELTSQMENGQYPANYQKMKKSKKLRSLEITEGFNRENTQEAIRKIKEILIQNQNTINIIIFNRVNLTAEQIGDLVQMIPNLEIVRLGYLSIDNQTVKIVLEKQKKLMALVVDGCTDVSKEYMVQLINQSKQLSVFYYKKESR